MYGYAAIVRGNSWFLNCYGKRGVLPAGSRKNTSFCVTVKNNPPAMQGERSSLDISMSSCANIDVGLQNHK